MNIHMIPRGATSHRTIDRDGVVTVVEPWSARELWILLGGVAGAAALATIAALFFFGSFGASGHRPGATARARGAVDDARDTDERAAPSIARPAADLGPMKWLAPEEAAARDAPGARVRRARMAVGVGAFPAPGTKRIKEGIVVPDDFPLPPGYVRHFQTTDRGEMLQAVLMFHPSYKPVDANGQPIPIPKDRVVPPEMAPPGLAIERLVVPKDAYVTPEEQGITDDGDEPADGEGAADRAP